MNISSHEEYGLRCALQLARHFGHGPLSASKIAEREGISVEYVSKFMHLFRKSGMVSSLRGTQGGFELSKEPEELKLKEILGALEVHTCDGSSFCQQFAGQREVCANFQECSIRPVWSMITFHLEKILESLSLADLLHPEILVRSKIDHVLMSNIRPLERRAENQERPREKSL
ncbi:MAG: hypothetical protein COV44_00820 [Deltaproteobacteria bacterium CG11_big_fil_rev_8_21_14_0_20_45_16]|nr:MAG: hypothetical protein COV44_00820 [Deltaproteobacteria bacterium CG11_big_fil_rev_8_21_14_0_20_45_16]